MISILFASRAKDNPDHNLIRFLHSFMAFTTPEERAKCEFLIKFDEDDDELDDATTFMDSISSEVTIKRYTWARNGGRNSLHEAQSLLYGYLNPDSKWIQIIADDFVFTRPGFVTDILNTDDNFTFIGKETQPVVRSIAPCFSRKFLDACCGYFGPQPNADGFSTQVNNIMKSKYNTDLGVDIPFYYQRYYGRQSEQWHENHNKLMKDQEMLDRIHDLVANNLWLNINNEFKK
jgi:hypothetical protein